MIDEKAAIASSSAIGISLITIASMYYFINMLTNSDQKPVIASSKKSSSNSYKSAKSRKSSSNSYKSAKSRKSSSNSYKSAKSQ
jgi:hypothetical protein